MSVIVELDAVVLEGTGASITATVKDDTDTTLGASQIATLTMTLFAAQTKGLTIINGNDQINILNDNQGTVDSEGNLTIALTALDTAIQNTSASREKHRMLITWTYGIGKTGKQVIDYYVVNLER